MTKKKVVKEKFKGPLATQKKKVLFLGHYSNTAQVKEAAKSVSVTPHTVYQWRSLDPLFKEKMDRMKPIIAQKLVDEAMRRAVDGVDKPVYQGGKRVGVIREYSDKLLSQLLKGMVPEVFGDRVQLDHKIKGKGLEDLTNAELAALIKDEK